MVQRAGWTAGSRIARGQAGGVCTQGVVPGPGYSVYTTLLYPAWYYTARVPPCCTLPSVSSRCTCDPPVRYQLGVYTARVARGAVLGSLPL